MGRKRNSDRKRKVGEGSWKSKPKPVSRGGRGGPGRSPITGRGPSTVSKKLNRKKAPVALKRLVGMPKVSSLASVPPPPPVKKGIIVSKKGSGDKATTRPLVSTEEVVPTTSGSVRMTRRMSVMTNVEEPAETPKAGTSTTIGTVAAVAAKHAKGRRGTRGAVSETETPGPRKMSVKNFEEPAEPRKAGTSGAAVVAAKRAKGRRGTGAVSQTETETPLLLGSSTLDDLLLEATSGSKGRAKTGGLTREAAKKVTRIMSVITKQRKAARRKAEAMRPKRLRLNPTKNDATADESESDNDEPPTEFQEVESVNHANENAVVEEENLPSNAIAESSQGHHTTTANPARRGQNNSWSFAQKKKLCLDIGKLASDKLGDLICLIKHLEPALKDSDPDNFELDFDRFQPNTLYMLRNFTSTEIGLLGNGKQRKVTQQEDKEEGRP